MLLILPEALSLLKISSKFVQGGRMLKLESALAFDLLFSVRY
jgi:hypothetical protein